MLHPAVPLLRNLLYACHDLPHLIEKHASAAETHGPKLALNSSGSASRSQTWELQPKLAAGKGLLEQPITPRLSNLSGPWQPQRWLLSCC